MPDETEQLDPEAEETLDPEDEGNAEAEAGDSKEGEAGQLDDETQAEDAAADYLEAVVRGETRQVKWDKDTVRPLVQKGLRFEEITRELSETKKKLGEAGQLAEIGRIVKQLADADPEVRDWLIQRAGAAKAGYEPEYRDPRVDALLAERELATLRENVPRWLGRELGADEDLDAIREAYPGLPLVDAYFLAHRAEILRYREKAAEKGTLTRLEESRRKAGPKKTGGGSAVKRRPTEDEFWREMELKVEDLE
ncbi:MAG: hypothetical protein C4551_02510 [Bacillota bacterium]|nr:MAG: hypothetical protein C4551_02510 [Bacillota bacterium]